MTTLSLSHQFPGYGQDGSHAFSRLHDGDGRESFYSVEISRALSRWENEGGAVQDFGIASLEGAPR
jgi:hypothetical protein